MMSRKFDRTSGRISSRCCCLAHSSRAEDGDGRAPCGRGITQPDCGAAGAPFAFNLGAWERRV